MTGFTNLSERSLMANYSLTYTVRRAKVKDEINEVIVRSLTRK